MYKIELSNTLATSEIDAFHEFVTTFDIRGKKILEIGGALPYEYIKTYSVTCWVAIDPNNDDNRPHETYKTIKGYAQLIPFDANEFDFIFSSNAFHHISNFELALHEMYKVLKPGGILYSSFGPIWSAPDGSHIENVSYQGATYNFWTHRLVPNWYHLIYNCRELYEIIRSRYEEGFARVIAEYVYTSNWLNRLFYHDFLSIIDNSGFKKLDLIGMKDFGYELPEPEYENKYKSKIARWELFVKDKKEYYTYRDLKMCLQK